MLIEQKLIKRIKKKQDKEAANALISYYYKEVYAYVYRQTGNEEQWNITITMINYNEDQSKNAGKSFGAKVVVKKGGYNPTIADYCSDGENLKDCIIKYGNSS